jgi:hypothetical protein
MDNGGGGGGSAPVDGRTRWTRTSGIAYPGTNGPIPWETTIYQTAAGPQLQAGSELFTARTEGLHDISYSVNWGACATSTVNATWLQVTNQDGTNARYASSQVTPPVNEAGATTEGSVTVYLRVGDTFSVNVFSSAGSPPGIQAAEVTASLVNAGGGGTVGGGWVPVALQNGWTGLAHYKVVGETVWVRVVSLVRGSAPHDSVFAILPEEAKPPSGQLVICAGDGAAVNGTRLLVMDISSTGNMKMESYYTGNTTFSHVYPLDISYLKSAPGGA